jgi:hypothetical protein
MSLLHRPRTLDPFCGAGLSRRDLHPVGSRPRWFRGSAALSLACMGSFLTGAALGALL